MKKYIWIHSTSKNFKQLNPILQEREIAIEDDTKYIKTGNGIDHYNDLPYINKPETPYESAVRNGFIGTEQEWLASLKGKDGESSYEIVKKLGFNGEHDEYYNNTISGISKESWGTF